MSRSAYALAILLSITALAPRASAQGAPLPDTSQTFLEFQVQQSVRPKVAAPPEYPARLRAARVEGDVVVQFVVDERGRAQMTSFKVIRSTHNELTEAVRRAVRESEFFPAEIGGRPVKQLVQQPYKFGARQ
jgi:periplasmic protein TonB